MKKKICLECGKPYDVDEWISCPNCAKKEYERRKKLPIHKPTEFWQPYTYPYPRPSRFSPIWCQAHTKLDTPEYIKRFLVSW